MHPAHRSALLFGFIAFATLAAAAPPVINNPDSFTFSFDRDDHALAHPYRIDAPGATSVTFSAFTLTLGGTGGAGGSQPFYDRQLNAVWIPAYPASWRFTIIASNADGEARKEVTVNMWPIESIFGVFTGSGIYRPGDTIRITVTYWLPVTVSGGTPYFGFALEGRPMQAPYVRGSGTDTLQFEFVVRPEDWGRVEIGAVQNNGAAITLSNGQAANNLVPAANWRIGFPTIRIEGPLATFAKLVNVSSRLPAAGQGGSATFIAGFTISGDTALPVLLRAAGPALSAYGISNPLADPRLALFNARGEMLTENDDWSGSAIVDAAAKAGAFPFVAGSRDAAIATTLPPGSYTLHVLANGATGIALAEVYSLSGTENQRPAITNISTRGVVEAGEGVLTAGFVIAGNAPRRVLVRAAGPALAAFGVSGVLADPRLRVQQADRVVGENDDWQLGNGEEVRTASLAAGAFLFTQNSRDAALVLMLPPGAYTALVTGANGTTGVALVEVYELP